MPPPDTDKRGISSLLGLSPYNLEKPMASRRQRAKSAALKKASIEADRKAAFIAHERAKAVKRNLATDNCETATVRDHHGIVKVVKTSAYSKITDSFNRMVQGGGLRECLNLDRPYGDSDRELLAFKRRLTNRR